MTVSQVFALCLKPGDTCFDVGANVGMSAEVISPLVGCTGRCISFECHPIHFTRLSALAARPGFENISPYCRALSDRPGHITLFAGTDPAVAQASTIVPALGNQERLGAAIIKLKVETDTLDRFCDAHSLVPHLIKVDVEGAEAQVFSGAREILRKALPHVIFEFGHGFPANQPPLHYVLLMELGYEFFVIDLYQFGGRPFTLRGEDPVLFSITTADIARAKPAGNIVALHRTKSAPLLRAMTVHAFADAEPHLARA